MPFHHKQVYSRPDPRGVKASGSGLQGEWVEGGTSDTGTLTGGLGGATQIQKAVDLREYQEGWKSLDQEAYNSGGWMLTNKSVFNYIGKTLYGAKGLDTLPIAELKAGLKIVTPSGKVNIDSDSRVNITLVVMNQQGLIDLR